MADMLQLEIVTPEREVMRTEVEEVEIPGAKGQIGVLPGHAPLITELAIGEIIYRKNGQRERLACSWGFAEVLPDKVTILAERAERAEEIDLARAEEAKRVGEERLRAAETPEDVSKALKRIERANVRIEVAKAD